MLAAIDDDDVDGNSTYADIKFLKTVTGLTSASFLSLPFALKICMFSWRLVAGDVSTVNEGGDGGCKC